MIPLFTNYVTQLQSQMNDYEKQLFELEKEKVRLKEIEKQIFEALNALENIVVELIDVDTQAVDLIKEALFTMLENNESIPENGISTSKYKSVDNSNSIDRLDVTHEANASDSNSNLVTAPSTKSNSSDCINSHTKKVYEPKVTKKEQYKYEDAPLLQYLN